MVENCSAVSTAQIPEESARRIVPVPWVRFLVSAVLLATAAGGALAQVAPAESPAVLTLETALAEAQQSNRLIKIAGQSVLFSNDQILAAKTQRYPQFNVQLSGSGLLTPISITVPKDSFGMVNGSPVPAQDSTITTNPTFLGNELDPDYPAAQPALQRAFECRADESGKNTEPGTIAAAAARNREFGERGLLRFAADPERAGCRERKCEGAAGDGPHHYRIISRRKRCCNTRVLE